MKKYFENDEILAIIWRWKKELGIVFVAAFLISALISSPFIIKPKYKSFARVYPSNLNSYSEESYSEQMLQLLESDVIRDKLIKEFDLQKHYDIKDSDKNKIENLHKEYDDNVRFNKTKYESVEIEVIDIDPGVAYKMLNRLIVIFNEQVKSVQDQQLTEAVKSIKYVLEVKGKEIDSLEKKINFIRRKYGILDYKSQVKNISKEYYKTLGGAKGSDGRIAKLERELENLKTKGAEYERLTSVLNSTQEETNKIKLDYDYKMKELSRNKKFANIIVNGYKSDKKVYPVRWLIISISVGSVMLFAFGIISFIDRVKFRS